MNREFPRASDVLAGEIEERMEQASDQIPGYTYGREQVATSPVSMAEFEALKVSVGFTQEDKQYLEMAADVIADQAQQIVRHWRNDILASIPHLAIHSRSTDGQLLPEYSARSNRRFEQWILDTCLRPYDQDWLNYQHEIALRHTSLKKNQTDGVESTSYIPLRHILGFVAVINETMKTYLAAKGHSAQEVDRMHLAWCRSIQLQMALWAKPYTDTRQAPNEW